VPKIKDMNRDPYDHRICAVCLAPMEPAFSHNNNQDDGHSNFLNGYSNSDDIKNDSNQTLNLFTNPFNKGQSNSLTNPITNNLANNAPNIFFDPPSVSIESNLIESVINSKDFTHLPINLEVDYNSSDNQTNNQQTNVNLPETVASLTSSLAPFSTTFPDQPSSSVKATTPLGLYPGSGYFYPDSFALPPSSFPVIEKGKENKSGSYQMGGLLLKMGGVIVVDGSIGVNNNADIYTAISSSSISSTSQSSTSNNNTSNKSGSNSYSSYTTDVPLADPLPATVPERTKVNANMSKFHRLTCIDCGIHVHLGCHNDLGYTFINEVTPAIIDGAPWKCDSCAVDEKDPRCILCPRRGGAFKSTSDSRWAHPFCCSNVPGHTKIIDGVVEVRIPKDCKKIKCSICNRQQGACVRCSYLGCMTYFHPLCAERGGKGYLRIRSCQKEAFCHQHIPEGVDRCEGYLVDGGEIHRLRITLDRSRVILDTLLRREKAKVRLCKFESDFFSNTFSRTLDRAKGRKHLEGLEYYDIDEESEYGDSGEDDEYGADEGHLRDISLGDGDGINGNNNRILNDNLGERNQVIEKLKAEVNLNDNEHRPIDFTVNRGDNKQFEYKGKDTSISGAWIKGTEVSLPRRLVVMVVGLSIQRKETAIEGGRKAYLRILKEKVDENLAVSRSQSDVFLSNREAQEFSKKLAPSLVKHMHMSDIEFAEYIKKSNVHAQILPDFEKMKNKHQSKVLRANMERLKRDQYKAREASYQRPPALFDAPADLGNSKRNRVTIHANLSLNKVLNSDENEDLNDFEYDLDGKGSGKNRKEKEPKRSLNGRKDDKEKTSKCDKDGKDYQNKNVKTNPDDNSAHSRDESLCFEKDGLSIVEGAERMIEVSGITLKNYLHFLSITPLPVTNIIYCLLDWL
jgi:hypothetical protein